MVRRYHRVNIGELTKDSKLINWIPTKREPSVEERWTLIRTGLQLLTQSLVPLQQWRTRSRLVWWKPKFDRALIIRARGWRLFRLKRSFRAWETYKRARNAAQSIQRLAKYEYERNLAKQVKYNPKRFDAYVQSKKNTREGIGTLELTNGSFVESDQEKADALLEFFKSVHRISSKRASTGGESCEDRVPTIAALDITEEDVFRELHTLNRNKSAGPDGLHPAIIQPLAEVLVKPVMYLFDQSIKESNLPLDWKTAVVVGIHKSGSRSKAGNYRPVSLTSVLCKCLERIIRRQICQHLTQHGLLSDAQHGFVKRRSCLTNLLSFLDEVSGLLDSGLRVDVCYLDFSKAFDSVNHRLLLRKLNGFGIAGAIHTWIVQFLQRNFCVRVGDSVSETAIATSGVPQGSVLGLILFLLFINDLASQLQNPAFIFADDVKIAGSESKQNGRVAYKWVSNVKDLDFMITKNLKVARQCSRAASKARKELFRLCATVSCRKAELFLPLYKTIVRPHLEYCVQAWSPYMRKDIAQLQYVQSLATRMVEGLNGNSYELRLRNLNLFSLERRRLRGDLIETFKIVKGLSGLKFDFFLSYSTIDSTRGHSLRLQRNYARVAIRAKFFANRVVRSWNKLPELVLQCTNVTGFKRELDSCWYQVFPTLI